MNTYFKKVARIFILPLTFILTPTHANFNKSEINSRIQQFKENQPIKAIIYGLWIDGKPVSVKAFGESMTKVPAAKKMHFRIGGVTETLLTTALMKLVEKRKLNLHDTVARFYPDLPNAHKVTLKMLANGTSGYPDYVDNKRFIDTVVNHPFKNWSSKEILHYAFMEPPRFEPGTNQKYSHTDYVLLGNILSKVTKRDLNKTLKSYIFKPLAIKNTKFSLTPEIPSPVLHSFGFDRGIYEDTTFFSPSWTSSSGSMTSTIHNLGTWANAWMKGYLLSPKSTAQLRAPDTVGKGQNTKDIYFGMGFVVANHWLFQNPSFGGYQGVFAVLPEKNIVFIAYTTLKPTETTPPHLPMLLWQELAAELAPEYPLPEFK